MRRNGYGPDIMHLLDNQALEDIGMSKGDVIRVKNGAQQWWNGPDAKRKRVDSECAGGSAASSFPDVGTAAGASGRGNLPSTPENQKVSFEIRYPDGGAQRLYGARLSPGSPGPNDKNTWYCCPVRNAWVPVPPGYRPVFAAEDPEEEDDFEDRDGEAAAALTALRTSGNGH
ncbi:hypothetical protein B0H13DRAFT_2342681 [Mycena leptocephala]|nr:hypothetical protein B0H13DRAFT_2342681 [Mycena leptocephala]